DPLPNTIQFISSTSTPASSVTPTPSTTTPGGTLTRHFNSLTGAGGSGTAEATITVNFYVPLKDGQSTPALVLDANTGDARTILNQASLPGTFTPIDTRDLPASMINALSGETPDSPGPTDFVAKSIAIQKCSNPGPFVKQGDTVVYTLDFQVSDFFAFQN